MFSWKMCSVKRYPPMIFMDKLNFGKFIVHGLFPLQPLSIFNSDFQNFRNQPEHCRILYSTFIFIPLKINQAQACKPAFTTVLVRVV